MSAYIVGHKTVQNVLSGLTLLEGKGYGITREFAKLGDKTTIGRLLLLMNEAAVYQRYPDDRETMGMGSAEEESFTFRPSMSCGRVQAYKSTQCLSYQCAEGDVPETALYKLLEELANALAGLIVSELPEYETATWG